MTSSTVRLTDDYLEHFAETVNAPTNPIAYLAIDPGKANGICGYDSRAYLQFMMNVHADDMIKFLNVFTNVKKCILENYLLYPSKMNKQIYSDMETSRVIGRVESWCELHKIRLIMQGAKIKPTAYKWLGQTPLPKSNPMNHQMDAHAHFVFWAIRTGLMKPEDLPGMRNAT